MKVLMLNGSFNPDGSTKAGLDIMAGTFAEEGVETEIVTVGAKPIADCIACGKCAELKRCVFANDAVNDFAEQAKTSDGFVFGSPVYYAHPSGRIQSFLDRLFFSTMRADWNEFHALTKEDVPEDPEGLQTLQNLARNMVYVMKCLKAGRDAGIMPPATKEEVFTNFVRRCE